MPPHEAAAAVRPPTAPSMLDLVRLSSRRLFPPGGEELFRQIAVLTDMSEGHEVLGVACGKGVALEYFVKEFGVVASGVDYDPYMVERADEWTREEGIADRLQFQTGRSDALPYRDDIFDLSMGEIGLANHCDPQDAVKELVRVTKPGGFVVLVQLVWKAPVEAARRQVLSQHLGARPMMVVEWKRILRESGVEEVHTEDWSDSETSFRSGVVKPFPDFAELFSLAEKIRVLRRAWSRWGWRGVSTVLAREREIHNLLTNERILGLDLLRGRRAHAPGGAAEEESVPAAVAALPHPSRAEGEDREDTSGLPLFGGPDPGSDAGPREDGER